MAARGRVMTLPDVLYSYRYHSSNVTLFNGTCAVSENHSENGDALAAFYMLGAMRLWAGNPPMLLESMLEKKSLKWNLKTLMILASAIWGHISPSTLRVFLRSSIRARDLLASVRVKDGRPYEWRYSNNSTVSVASIGSFTREVLRLPTHAAIEPHEAFNSIGEDNDDV